MKFPARKTLIALSAALAMGIAIPSFAGKMMDADSRLERMSANLSLTEDQVQQLKPLMERHQADMDSFREARQAERDRVREQMKAMRDQHYEDLKRVLNEEQIAKLEQQREQRMKRHEGRKGHHGGKELCDHHKGDKYRD